MLKKKIVRHYRVVALCVMSWILLDGLLAREAFAQTRSGKVRSRVEKVPKKSEPVVNETLQEGPAPGLETLDEALDMGRKPRQKNKSQWGFHSLILEGVGGYVQLSEGAPLSNWGAGFGLGFGLHENFRVMVALETLPDQRNSVGRDERGFFVASSFVYRMSETDWVPGLEVGATFGSMSWNNQSAIAYGPFVQYGYRLDSLGISPVVRAQYLLGSDSVGGNVLQVYGGVLFERDF